MSLCLFCCAPWNAVSLAQGATNNQSIDIGAIAPEQIDSVLAKLSDEQVRSLLITELQKDVTVSSGKESKQKGFVAQVGRGLHLLDDEGGTTFGQRLQRSWRHSKTLPDELSWVLRKFAEDSSIKTAWKNIGFLLGIFCLAYLAELLFRAATGGIRQRFQEQMMPELVGMMRFLAAVLYELPSFVHLVLFSVTALLLYFWSFATESQPLRFLFLALLFVIVTLRGVQHLSLMFTAPNNEKLRLLPISNTAAKRLHGVIVFLSAYVLASITLLALLRELGLQRISLSLLAIGFATSLLLLIAIIALLNRGLVATYLTEDQVADSGTGWLMLQLAVLWHVLLFGYLLMVWGFLLYNQFSGSGRQNGAFLISLFLVPIFLIMDRVAGWVIRSVVRTMRIYEVPLDEHDENYSRELAAQKQKERQLVIRLWRAARMGILASLGVWLFSLWGYQIPYAAAIVDATFDILVTLTLALVFWRVASSYIERKIQEATPEEKENEDQDDEWGPAATRGRSYTLLPMVRKFLGTVMVVMVTLIILSSLGVDIGPLLAGAGVVGLAIGFGAQKLVSDVFSGFFYLLDDAFRVGEYMQAGSVSGAVEAITLRNVMLRHHRGMLQIVPYSELGAITNFMRGGIIVKFRLEFPYDTDIDKVRKIIKKVGLSMLEDPEFGKNFIRPVKSQGVREIVNSVMVIGVKFTAQPGTHFVIRREAYRRITEALAAKGIHYAHRKVIVEIPQEEEHQGQAPSANMVHQALEAGAAASQVSMTADEANKEG